MLEQSTEFPAVVKFDLVEATRALEYLLWWNYWFIFALK